MLQKSITLSSGPRLVLRVAVLGAAVLAGASTAEAQMTRGIPGVYQPLDQTAPVGKTALWTAFQGKTTPPIWQPIRIEVEGGASVTFFNPGVRPVTAVAPARAAVAIGHVYRLRIGDLHELPGAELWPSIEMLDRLHPPPGMSDTFPIPVQITREEIELALDGRLITKVIYLEQPDLAAPVDQQQFVRVADVPPHANLFAEADLLGRPMAILRLGGRTPDPRRPDPAFFGTGAPILVPPEVVQGAMQGAAARPHQTPALTEADAEFLRQARAATPGLRSRASISAGVSAQP